MISSINPFDGKLLAEFSALTPEELNKKISDAGEAFRSWRNSSFQNRKILMLKLSEILHDKKDELSRIATLEMGKLFIESGLEIEKCSRLCKYYGENAEQFLADETIETEAEKSFIHYEPMGVILGVMPWNFPYWQVLRFAVPAIMAGNVCLLKHASNVPQCAVLIEELFTEVGFPPAVFQTLMIDSSSVEKIISHHLVKGISLTGSEHAGSSVASLAGKQIKKTVLELGGSDPFIVLHDAEINFAVKNAVSSRLGNNGQSCIAAKRFIVSEKIVDEFTDKLKEKFLSLQSGNPINKKTQVSVMAREDLAVELEMQVNKSIDKGAQIICGGRREAAFFQPTILVKVKPGMPAFDEELFGPVAAIISFTTEEEAIRLANNSQFGLGGSVWTKDVARGISLAKQVECGSVYVNTLMKSDQRMPFGGIKKSGYGRELSLHGIREFVNVKSVMVNS